MLSYLLQESLLLQHSDTAVRLTISSANVAIAMAAAAGFSGDLGAGMVEQYKPAGMLVSASIGQDGVMRYFEHTPEGLCDSKIK